MRFCVDWDGPGNTWVLGEIIVLTSEVSRSLLMLSPLAISSMSKLPSASETLIDKINYKLIYIILVVYYISSILVLYSSLNGP